MKKFLAFVFASLVCTFCLFAGDVAEYCDLGFSSDGKYFTFAQYGVTDKEFLPYAEIYTVDVAKNAYTSDGIFKYYPKTASEIKGGKMAFDELYKKNKAYIEKHSGVKPNLNNTLYLRGPEIKDSDEQIVFKDFLNSTSENQIFYHINLVKNVSQSKNDVKSSFFIAVERKDNNDNVISSQVAGNADYKRKNVSDYVIRRIISDNAGKFLVFEIEKRIEDATGTSFRYMVETLELEK